MIVVCNHCRRPLNISHDVIGREIRCPVCQWKFIAQLTGSEDGAAGPSTNGLEPVQDGRILAPHGPDLGLKPARSRVFLLVGALLIGCLVTTTVVVAPRCWSAVTLAIAERNANQALAAAENWMETVGAAGSEAIDRQLASVLESAVSDEKKEQVRTALLQIAERRRQRQAENLWDQVHTAISQPDVPLAVKLLQDYLNHPVAENKGVASDLLRQCLQSTSDAEAVRVLAALSEADLSVFSTTGELPADTGPAEAHLAVEFRQRLRGHLGKEMARREVLKLQEKPPSKGASGLHK